MNVAIKLYDQLDVIPIYQTCVMFSWAFIGLTIYEEYKLYNGVELFGIIFSIVICFVGVKFLTMKRTDKVINPKEIPSEAKSQ